MTGGGDGDGGEGNSWLTALIELALRVQLIIRICCMNFNEINIFYDPKGCL